MEKLYSKADCMGLIQEITKYNEGISSSNNLLSSIDMIHRLNPFLWKNSIINIDEFIKNLRIILMEIITLFINKKAIEKNDDDIEKFFSNISFGIKISEEKYPVIKKEETDEYKKKCYDVINNNKYLK